jgi:ribulose-phosphate 3-epimerase|tara:strand:- start:7829 stop:8506 length:678 start_codon:yes stop_codon:yes gene_type:complete
MKNIKICASLICGNPIDLNSDLLELKKSNTDLIHFDVMDGQFVPRYGLYPEILKSVKENFNFEIDVHMMTYDAEDYILDFKNAGADYYNVHVESTNHLSRVIKKISDSGMKPGVGINPGTPLNSLDWVINDIKMVVLMAINPGIVGHKLIPNIINKISELRNYADRAGNKDLIIQIDGGVTPESIPLMINAGADALVCGTGTIFRPHEDTISNKVNYIKNLINEI